MAKSAAPVIAGNVYEDGVVRAFALAAVLWGVVGMLVGVIIAAQLTWPELNLGIPWLSYGRLRPLYTNTVIFAFGGCSLFATVYHVVQRTGQTRLFAPMLAWFTFWGWQLVILSAAITLPLGITQGKEYAELEWPIDLLITVVWVSYAIVFFGTVGTRKVKHIYVANWFFGAFIIAVALLHVVNAAALPVSLTKSYSAYAGVQDAIVQWWYGHNAVGFFLTAGFLGMMYYYIPKQAGRPAGLQLPLVHRPLLGLDLHLHVGGPPPSALHGAAGLGAKRGHGVLAGAAGTELGRHDQRHHDFERRLAQTA
jgi:cytochrome c oxidase cbb3-type subunit 1